MDHLNRNDNDTDLLEAYATDVFLESAHNPTVFLAALTKALEQLEYIRGSEAA
jgi:hypothetical protein